MRIGDFCERLAERDAPMRTAGTAVYLTQSLDDIPEALVQNLKHNGVVHEQVILLRVSTERIPRVDDAARVEVKDFSAGFRQVELRFGFAEKPDVPAALNAHRDAVGFDPSNCSFFLGREMPVPSMHPELPRWQERVYAFLAHNAVRAPDYFLIPHSQVVELGTRVEM